MKVYLSVVAVVLAGCSAQVDSTPTAHPAPLVNHTAAPDDQVGLDFKVLSGWKDIVDASTLGRMRLVQINGVCFIETDGEYNHANLTLAEYKSGNSGYLTSVCDGP